MQTIPRVCWYMRVQSDPDCGAVAAGKGCMMEKQQKHSIFRWEALGDIKMGRSNLGEEMPVLVYRLMQYTMLDVLTRACGEEQANEYFREAGRLAGMEFTKNLFDLKADYGTFIAQVQKKLLELKIGILRLEVSDAQSGEVVLTIAEDLDCSGLPPSDENVCVYDEGFIGGMLEIYTGRRYRVREIDCWANGGRVCRFHCTRG